MLCLCLYELFSNLTMMNEKEFKETMALLEAAGWQPQLCDTPIPLYESVHAGNPDDPSNIPPDMVLVPKAFMSLYRESMVRVKGNSMIDRGIEDGDMVRMVYGQTPRDGDIVVVAIGTECTLKCYYEDDDGTPWLVPQNRAEKEKYRAIRLDGNHESVYLCGVVTELCKPLPRVPNRAMRGLVNETKDKMPPVQRGQVVEQLIADDLLSKLMPIFYNSERDVRLFLKEVNGMQDKDITDLVNKWVGEKRITDYGNSRKGDLWSILNDVGLYASSRQNWCRRVY